MVVETLDNKTIIQSHLCLPSLRRLTPLVAWRILRPPLGDPGTPSGCSPMSKPDTLAIKVLYEQVHALRAQVDNIKPEDADKPRWPGSGISVLIPQFNRLLERTQAALAEEPLLSDAIADIQPVNNIEESSQVRFHKKSKQEVLFGCDMLLRALAPRLLNAAGTPPMVTREGLFLPGQRFDALQFAVQILSMAQTTIVIIDGYIHHDVLSLLKAKRDGVMVQILTKAKALPPDIPPLASAFNQQYGQKGSLSIRTSEAFHDRFLIIDDTDFYHFGASLKDLGSRGFMFSRIEEPAVIEALRKTFTEEWSTAPTVV